METLIVELKSRKQLNTIKAVLKALDVTFRQEQESPYNPEFVARIRKSEQQFEEGKVTRVTKENIQSFLGLE